MHILSTSEVPEAAIERCLRAIEDGDPLITPFDVPSSGRGHGLAAVDDSGDVHAVGWLRPRGDLTEIDLRVAPGRRRSGVGKALFAALARPEDHLISSCDPAQRRAVKFLEARGFQLRSVLFAQRWDGEVEDVPAAFRTATLADCTDREEPWTILVESMADSWPGPSIDRATFLDPETRVRTASMEGQVVGVLAARRQGDAYNLGGMGVLQPWRKRGIGRVLLCEQMTLAAQEDIGLVLHVAHDNETFLGWTRNLGFWTFRSWAIFERPPVS